MDVLVALGVSIGILIAAWTYIALGTAAALPVWAGIVAWGCFFAAGGKTTGLTKTIASNVSGVFWAFVALYLSASLPGIGALSLLVGVAAPRKAPGINDRTAILDWSTMKRAATPTRSDSAPMPGKLALR